MSAIFNALARAMAGRVHDPAMRPIPLVPDCASVHTKAARVLARQATSLYLAAARQQHVDEIIKANWPHDRVLNKAAVIPLLMSDLGIAGTADIAPIIAPSSAFAALSAAGITISLAGRTSKTVPVRVTDANDAGAFVAEGAPIPVRQSTIAADQQSRRTSLRASSSSPTNSPSTVMLR